MESKKAVKALSLPCDLRFKMIPSWWKWCNYDGYPNYPIEILSCLVRCRCWQLYQCDSYPKRISCGVEVENGTATLRRWAHTPPSKKSRPFWSSSHHSVYGCLVVFEIKALSSSNTDRYTLTNFELCKKFVCWCFDPSSLSHILPTSQVSKGLRTVNANEYVLE